MTEASVSFAGNLTDQPEVRYTESGIARATFRVAISGQRTRRRRSSPSWSGATRPSTPRNPSQKAAGWWS
jgi:single-stranded DNA-binding protein